MSRTHATPLELAQPRRRARAGSPAAGTLGRAPRPIRPTEPPVEPEAPSRRRSDETDAGPDQPGRRGLARDGPSRRRGGSALSVPVDPDPADRWLGALAVHPAAAEVACGHRARVTVRDDPPRRRTPVEGAIAVPDDRPVVPTELAWQEGVEAAAEAAREDRRRGYQNYDEEVDEATAPDDRRVRRGVPRRPTDDVREEFVAQKTDGGGPGGRPGRRPRQRHRAGPGAALPQPATSSRQGKDPDDVHAVPRAGHRW